VSRRDLHALASQATYVVTTYGPRTHLIATKRRRPDLSRSDEPIGIVVENDA
jgi:hypothetical protein